ncbi:hypothetical protein OK074_2260 [Actinobacteria bacterium OK074]|nr:hypothetical protein OK074_2260 [Actinobacteria bacterium OK074]
MEAGPRDTAKRAEQGGGPSAEQPVPDDAADRPVPGTESELPDPDTDPLDDVLGDALSSDGPDDDPLPGGVTADGPDAEELAAAGPEVEVELRPQRRLRLWHLAPIVTLAAVGSLMFAFPLAFEFGDGGAVVAMLGLLICSCAAGWGMMAARRVGHTLPGLPPRGSGRWPDWRVVVAYVVVIAAVVVLAVWRVARLR